MSQNERDALRPFSMSPHSRSLSLHHIINGHQHNTPFQWFPGHIHTLVSRLNPHKNISGYLTRHCTSVTTTISGANVSGRASSSLVAAASTTPMQGDNDDDS